MTYVGFNPQPNTDSLQQRRADAIESTLDDLMLGDGDELAGALVKYFGHSDLASILAGMLVRSPCGRGLHEVLEMHDRDVQKVSEMLAEKMMAEPYDKGGDD